MHEARFEEENEAWVKRFDSTLERNARRYFIQTYNQTRRRGDMINNGAKLEAYREQVKGLNGSSWYSYVIDERDENQPMSSFLSEVAEVLQQNGQNKYP